MVSLGNYFQVINLKFTAFLKILSFIFLIWTFITYKDMDIFPKSLENKNLHGDIFNRNHHRLLSKHELHRELGYSRTNTKLSRDSISKNRKNIENDISICSQLHKKGLNNLDTYMKNYKRRYAKKKGLSKLDCYCEKKVFDRINYIYTLSDKMRSDKNGFKKKILKKYGIGFIILTLIPALGLIFYILFGYNEELGGAIKLCNDSGHYTGDNHTNEGCTALNAKRWKTTVENIEISNVIFSFTTITVVLLFFIYILTKVIKYEKLKAGKDKMKINEYYRFCKDIF
ncbi:Plasmodium exported protein, unknown function [Plasmodium vivax]|uniref:Variable surface protein Vir35 n=1 Tax=Plasmodium vivax TaxID=5855 RepID=A0A565A410_PLAVI|nr:Plasmodium exported protein, unknown function [Plasmodium vivax]